MVWQTYMNVRPPFFKVCNLEGNESASEKDWKIDIKILIGSAEELGKSSISSCIMQMFLEDILACMISPESDLVVASFDLTALILNQGLVHPILVSF
jgi:hypothetical protein